MATTRRALALHPMGRFGTTQEVADAVVFLCSNKASYITGTRFRWMRDSLLGN